MAPHRKTGSARSVRQSVTIPATLVGAVRRTAKEQHLTMSRALVALAERGVRAEAEAKEQLKASYKMQVEKLPLGGVTPRKYAAICLALGMARGALYSAMEGDTKGIKDIVDLTSLAHLADALKATESELAIMWDEHLLHEELERIKGFGPKRKEISNE